MKKLFTKLKHLVFWLATVGVDPKEGSSSNRVTIFTNIIAILGVVVGGSIYTQLDQYGAPPNSIYAYNFAVFLTSFLLISNYFGYRHIARVLALMVMLFVGWTAAVFFGKSFNGIYFFIVTTIFAIGAFSKSKTSLRILYISFPVISMFVMDTLSHKGVLPITGFHSSNFPVSLLYVDTFFTLSLVIVTVWVEKSLADKHEAGLESALETIRDEKQKMSVIFENVELGILITDSQLNIDKQYSKYLSRMFKTDRIGDENLLEFLLTRSSLDKDSKATIQTVLFNCIGEDELNWMINKDHLPSELAIAVGYEVKYLNLNWSPVINNEVVARLVVSLRDVTQEVKAKEQEILQKAVEKKIKILLRALIKVGLRQTREFISSINKYITETQEVDLLAKKEEHLEILHTFKGEARLIGFTNLANFIHEVELGLIQNSLENVVRHELEKEVNLIFAAEQKLFVGSDDEAQQVWSLLPYVQSLISRMNEQIHSQDFGLKLSGIEIQDNVIVWPEKNVKLIENILLHSFQNSLDHGFIRPQKKGDVRIQVQADVGVNGYRLVVRDNGAGINEDALKQKWLKLTKEEQQIYKTPFALLFRSGYSSAMDVSITSGQGVGLAAVHQAVKSLSGVVSIKNRNDVPGTELEVFIPHKIRDELQKAS